MHLCISIIVVLLAAGAPARASSDDVVWSNFIQWYRTNPADDSLLQLLKNYRVLLTGKGLSEADADAQLALLRKLASERTDAVAVHFDKVYTSAKPTFNVKPNAFLVEVTSNLTPGTALDVAMGQGRNALWLAQKGWTVTGFDISAEGLAVAQANAGIAGLKLTTAQVSYKDFDWGKDQWDLIVMSYAFVPLSDSTAIQKVCESLKPGGKLVYEFFLPDPTPPGMPRNVILKAFGDLHVLRYEDVITQPDWGSTQAHVGRLFATKL